MYVARCLGGDASSTVASRCNTPVGISRLNWRLLLLLLQERKELVAGGYKDRHNAVGSWLLGAGVVIAIEGALNTYARTGGFGQQ